MFSKALDGIEFCGLHGKYIVHKQKKILLTTRNVRLDSDCYATKYYFSSCQRIKINRILTNKDAVFKKKLSGIRHDKKIHF